MDAMSLAAEKDSGVRAEKLGCAIFRARHNLRFACVAGSMYKGIASKEIVIKMARAGMLGFLGTGGMKLDRMEQDIRVIQRELQPGQSYGANLLCNVVQPEVERQTVDLLLRLKVSRVEASAYTQVSSELVRYRLKGLREKNDGTVECTNKLIGKVSRPEVAEQFMSPAPERLVQKLVENGGVTKEEADLSRRVPMAEDVCVEADSGGHTDRGVAYALVPAIIMLRNQLEEKFGYAEKICVGASGGLGTPHAIAASFILGADFVLTGSVNQCTVEAGTSDAVKDLLQNAEVQDTDIVPAGDMFEMGAKVQVFKKGLLFPTRAKKLYEIWRQYSSIDEIDEATRKQIEQKYFKKSFEDVFAETREHYGKVFPAAIARAEKDPRHKMALIFRWYFVHGNRMALSGNVNATEDFQIHCGPALGSFNSWVKGTKLEYWRNRHVDEINEKLMVEAAGLLERRFQEMRDGE